ncbi:cytochrome P450 [Tricladium varicosporioides]|nr:cytochrome P450 [Hymenoscyphus varicosporioides]
MALLTVVVYAMVLTGIYKFLLVPLFLSPLSQIPSAHPTSHILPFWIYYIRWVNIENGTLYDLHKKKGPILRLAPNELSVNCYEGGIKTIYGGGFEKTDFYARIFHNYDGTTNMLSMVDSQLHAKRKRMLSNVYSKSYVLSSPTIQFTTKSIMFGRLLPLFQGSSETKTPIEVLSLNYAYSMDAFMVYQFGLDLGSNFIENTPQREWYLRNFFIRRPYMFWTTEVPTFNSMVKKIGFRLVPKWCDKSTTELEDWNLDICDKAESILSEQAVPDSTNVPVIYSQVRQGMRKQGQDLESTYNPNFLQAKQKYPHRLEIASEMFDHNAAALETSGITLTYVYYELSRRPELQACLRKELLTLSPPILFPILKGQEPLLPDSKAVDALPLLDAILQETLRLWAAVPGGQPRKTPSPSCTLAGYKNIPPGVRVQSSAYILHRNEEVFPEPEEWRPERWLDASPRQLVEMRRWLWAFGSGGRMCIGSNFAIHSMKHAIAGIYTNFLSSIVNSEGIEQAEGFTAGPRGNKLVLRYQHV